MPATLTTPRTPSVPGRLARPASKSTALGVFGSNRQRPFHRWYPFVEGFSAELVEQALAHGAPDGVVLDPFGGSGTTALAAAMLGRDSIYAEVNPYLAWIADVKVNQSQYVDQKGVQALRSLASTIEMALPATKAHPLLVADSKRQFFPAGVASTVIGLLARIDNEFVGPTRDVARLAVASALVPASQMIRRTDLRKRTLNDGAPLPLRTEVAQRLLTFADDLERHGAALSGRTVHIAGDVRDDWIEKPDVSLVVTSPPYLNGTNYCRNTKLELLALGYIEDEKDLQSLRVSMISAGINNVSKRRRTADEIDCVEPIAIQLDKVAYDARIPQLVRTYFSDMKQALQKVRQHTVVGGHMYFDIGDSRYSGIHVPTHRILRTIADADGWSFIDEDVLRTRRSYDGSALTQVLMHFVAV